MKALVLAGGFPQIDLLQKLKARGINTILADYFEHPIAEEFADKFVRISTLDIDAIRDLAIQEEVSFLMTVCTDQALLTVARVSEELGLPCYIDHETARKVTNKCFMKEIFAKNGIPTAEFRIVKSKKEIDLEALHYPLIVKPVDCNSSKGVSLVSSENELYAAIDNAILLSRSDTAIVEEYIEGKELSVDVYVEEGIAKILDITTSEKLNLDGKFIIFRTWHPARLTDETKNKVQDIIQNIAITFNLHNTPMLVQMLVKGKDVFVIEFSARTGGGVKHISIKKRTGFDVVSAVIDLTLGIIPNLKLDSPKSKYMMDEYLYCYPGKFDHFEGFEQLKAKGIISDYYVFCRKGACFEEIRSSGDRIAGFTIEANSLELLKEKYMICIKSIKAVSRDGRDIIRHDLIEKFDYQ